MKHQRVRKEVCKHDQYKVNYSLILHPVRVGLSTVSNIMKNVSTQCNESHQNVIHLNLHISCCRFHAVCFMLYTSTNTHEVPLVNKVVAVCDSAANFSSLVLSYVNLSLYSEIRSFGSGPLLPTASAKEAIYFWGRNLEAQMCGCETQIFSLCLFHKQNPWKQTQHWILKLHVHYHSHD